MLEEAPGPSPRTHPPTGPPPPHSRAARLTLGLPCRGLPALSQPRRFAGRGRTGPCGAARRRPVGGAAGLHVGRAVGGWSERDRLGGGGGGAPRRAGGQPGTFLFGAGRSGSCAGVARTLLISQCWDGASWARRGGGGGGGRPQPVPGGGGSSSRCSSSRGSRPAGLPFCLARHVPGRPALSEAASVPLPRWLQPRRVGAPRRRCLSGSPPSLPSFPPSPGREDGPRPAAGLQPQGREVERGVRPPGPARQHLPAPPDRPAGQRCVGRRAGGRLCPAAGGERGADGRRAAGRAASGGGRSWGGLPGPRVHPLSSRGWRQPESRAVRTPSPAVTGSRCRASTRVGVRALVCIKISG